MEGNKSHVSITQFWFCNINYLPISNATFWSKLYRNLTSSWRENLFLNNVKHKNSSLLSAYNSKSTFLTSDSFPLIMSQILTGRLFCTHNMHNSAVASLTVPGGQEFHFSQFFLKFQSIFLIFPQTLLIFFLILALQVGKSPTREGPGYATDAQSEVRVLTCTSGYQQQYPKDSEVSTLTIRKCFYSNLKSWQTGGHDGESPVGSLQVGSRSMFPRISFWTIWRFSQQGK